MKLTFLGTGTSQGVPPIGCKTPVCLSTNLKDKRLRSSVMVEINKQRLVIDCGPDFREQMLRADVRALDGVLFTHEHRDHTAGLDDLRSFNFLMKQSIPIYCTSQVESYLEKAFDYIFEKKGVPGIAQLEVNEIADETFKAGEVEIQPIPVLHHKLPVLGFRFGNLAYITDANHIPDSSIEKLRGLDVLVLNALRKEEHISHFSLQQALDIIEQIKPERAYLTHISYRLGFHEDVQADLPPNVFLAYDGLEIESS